MTIVDPGEVRILGENSFIRLAQREEGEFSTMASHWRVLYSPEGPGHALFLQSDLTDNQVVVYSDNIALARRLQGEIEAMLHAPFADTSLPVVESSFERVGDVRSYITERVISREGDISLTWYDFLPAFLLNVPAGTNGRTHGVYTVFFPGRRAQVVMNGQVALGAPRRAERGGRESTTACIAWSETWVRP